MERLLWLYALPYDPAYPVVCYDERPCFLIGQLAAPMQLQAGRLAREHYAYLKHGSCSLLASIEPLTGQRLAQIYEQRTKQEYALHLKALAARYPDAIQIRVVQDNLNTHDRSALYENFPAAEAQALDARFDFYHTPVRASWLNMIEIEFSALARQCLKRRIPTQEQLEREVLTWMQERECQGIRIHWQFTLEAARDKFQRHYEAIRTDRKKDDKKNDNATGENASPLK